MQFLSFFVADATEVLVVVSFRLVPMWEDAATKLQKVGEKDAQETKNISFFYFFVAFLAEKACIFT